MRWIYAIGFEILALLGVIILRLLPYREKLPGTGTPLLLVHGYVNHGSVWAFQKRWLQKSGLGPIYTINLGYPFSSIEEYAQKIKEKAQLILQETGQKELILVGHSMGGLVSSWYATHLAEPGTVQRVITIASPFQGTPMARIALGKNGRQMEPNSPFLEALEKGMKCSKIAFHHIATTCDALVIPGISAVRKGDPHLIVDDLGHASLLYSPRVAKQISDWILADRPTMEMI